MRAMLLEQIGQPLQLRELPVPQPGPGEVRVRVLACGVCRTDLHVVDGELPEAPLPIIPGHEIVGRVDALGEGVTGVAVGDRVAALSHKSFAEYDVADEAAVVKLPPALAGKPFPGEPLGCAMNIFRRAEIKAGQTVAIVGEVPLSRLWHAVPSYPTISEVWLRLLDQLR